MSNHFTRCLVLSVFIGCSIVACAAGSDDDSDGSANGSTGSQDPDPIVEAAGLSISEIAIFQGVKRPLMAGGAAVASDIPIVAGRDALLRVYVALGPDFEPAPVTARLWVGEGAGPIDVDLTLGSDSSDAVLGSTINFDIPGDQVTPEFAYRVLIGRAPGGPKGSGGLWPATGFDTVGARSGGPALKITLVPVQYDADGSGRVPDTSAARVQEFRDAFFGLYPAPSVEITVHAPMPHSIDVSPNGDGWDEVLDAITDLRLQEGTAPDVYFHGLVMPSGSFESYCGSSCTTGLGNIAGPTDDYARSAVGLGFPGEKAVGTSLHEIGHNHGRRHAPCDAGNLDPNYPHPGAEIGVWGYDLVSGTLLSPSSVTDFMGYCDPSWISDYSFIGVFERMELMASASVHYAPESLDRIYDRVRVRMNGDVEWMEPIQLHLPPAAEPTAITVESSAGDQQLTGHFYARNHLPGGVLVMPRVPSGSKTLRFRANGKALQITRSPW